MTWLSSKWKELWREFAYAAAINTIAAAQARMKTLRTGRDYHLAFAALLTVAAAIRIVFDNVTSFSPADETVYLRYTQILAGGGGYARVVRMFIADRGMWVFPNPLRWSYLGATTLFCQFAGHCSYRTLAMLST